MKLKLPVLLLSALMAAYTAQADTLLPSGSYDSVVSMADGQFSLSEDTNYTNVHFYSDDEMGGTIMSIIFDGGGQYGLRMGKDESDTVVDKPKPNQRRHLIYLRDFTQNTDLSLTFTNLTELRMDGTGQKTTLSNGAGAYLYGGGDASINVKDVSGDVYMGGFNDSSALSVQSNRHAVIAISGVGGKFSVVDNSTVNMSNYSPGLLAWSHGTGGDALILLSDIQGGIDVSRNENPGGFTGVSVASQYGASDIIIEDIAGGITMDDNKGVAGPLNVVGDTDGAIRIERISGDIVLKGNEAEMFGGAGYVEATTGEAIFSIRDVDGNVKFTDNSAVMYGGAILINASDSTGGEFTIADIRGDVVFSGNNADAVGGAIFSLGNSTDGADDAFIDMTLSADGGNITFENNTAGGTASGIFATGRHNIALRAAEGRTVSFYDPLLLEDGISSTLDINKGDNGRAYDGKVVFSGAKVDNSDPANLESVIDADANLYGGTLSIEDGAVLATNTMTQYGGTLSIASGSTLETDNYRQSGGSLVLGRGGMLNASDNVTVTNLTVDLGSGGGTAASIAVSAGSLRVDGSITLLSSSPGALESGDPVLVVSAASIEGQLASPDSIQTRVISDSGLESEVHISWGGIVVDGATSLQTLSLYSTSSVLGVVPELYGSNVANSLLSSVSNLETFTSGALAHVNTVRFGMKKDTYLWAHGLGDFTSQRSKGGIDGYDYNGGGYSIGIDRRIGKEWLAGVGYGQLFGRNMSRDYDARIKQRSVMGMVYGAWHRQLNDANALTVTGSIAYGSTDNDLTTRQWDGKRSQGDWYSNTFLYNLRAAWNISLKNGYTLSPFIGLEYTNAIQDSFTETGERTRRFDRGHYRNLSSPVGVELSKTYALPNGMLWYNGVSVSYVPDLYRHNTETNAVLGGYRWHVNGIKPARNAVRAGIYSNLRMTESWSAYCGYSLEGRSNAAWHQVNLGVGYSF